MRRITVVGSGASGVHFALTALERGHRVRLVDVGTDIGSESGPDLDLIELRERLPDPAAYFLGSRFEGVHLPRAFGAEYYGIPPHRGRVLSTPAVHRVSASGIAPQFSYARGGLAEVWTGGCYPFDQRDLREFPVDRDDLAPYYDRVAERIGISGAADDLAQEVPLHAHLQSALDLDEHGADLLAVYGRRRERIRRLGAVLGRSRVAVLSRARGDGREACDYLDRCLWGCPRGAIYTPRATLAECRRSRGFDYAPGRYVTHFRFDDQRRVMALVSEPPEGGPPREEAVEELVLAAGTLSSTRIVLESIYRAIGAIARLDGLMDNRQVLVPFVNLRRLGKPWTRRAYQYNQLALGLREPSDGDYVHCLLTTLKAALLHPIVQGLPTDLRTALALFRRLHGAVGLVNVNFSDYRRVDCSATLEPDGSARPRLRLDYHPAVGEPQRLRRSLRRLRRVLATLGCVVPPGLTRVRPIGAGVHYAGTLPMSVEPRPFTVDHYGRSHDFANLRIVDGAILPWLPAKNLTFTLMANATRIADRIGTG